MNAARIKVKLIMVSAPVLSFVYGVVTMMAARPDNLSLIAKALAFGQMLGALPGITLALLHSANLNVPSRVRVVVDICVSVGVIVPLAVFLGVADVMSMLVIVSAFASAYVDIFFKRFSPSALSISRGAQSVAWVSCSAIVLCNGAGVGMVWLLLGRSVGCAASLIGLVRLRVIGGVDNALDKSSVLVRARDNLIWMFGSNSIFLLPVMLLKDGGPILLSNAVIIYVSQLSLQVAGRLSDYYTTQDRLRCKVGYGENVFLIFLSAGLLVGVVSLKYSGALFDNFVLLFSVLGLVVASLVWAVADSTLSILVLSNPLGSRFAAVCGASAFVVVIIGVIISGLLPASWMSISHSIVCLVGGVVYLAASRFRGG